MSDLVKRLRRRIIVDGCEMPGNDALHREAADEIERLRAELVDLQQRAADRANQDAEEIERLRAALEEIKAVAGKGAGFYTDRIYTIAREALDEGKD